jgi:hypothetical protein
MNRIGGERGQCFEQGQHPPFSVAKRTIGSRAEGSAEAGGGSEGSGEGEVGIAADVISCFLGRRPGFLIR